jgi:hypothetical protein
VLKLSARAAKLSIAAPGRRNSTSSIPGVVPDASFGNGWISCSLAHSSPTPGLTACSCSYGRAFATRFFQAGLTVSPLRFTTVVVTSSGYLL